MVRPKQVDQHPNLQEAIKQTARKQIAKNGAAALSLRAIARELSITAPAIYDYFSRRDDLVTALIVDAYHSLAAALATSQETDRESHAERIMASANAYRNWARVHSEEYSLIFGTPIPGYEAPAEITEPAAASSMAVLIGILDTAWRDGALKMDKLFSSTPEMIQAWIDKIEYDGAPEVIHYAMASWALIHGMVSLELNGHFTPMQGEISVDSFFETEIRAMIVRTIIA